MKNIIAIGIILSLFTITEANAQYYPYGYPIGAGIASALIGTAIGGLYTTPYPYYPYAYVPQCWNQVVGYDAYGNQVIQRFCK